ncbi:MAG: protein-export membrane protein SecD [Candidatus Magasanikbacteria bacterium RIFOXYD1_FULL_40_23]|uniref:Protein translocase subunit SecD n=1 Tax=Candidatus Magasanikbacteria bacterium RIFOXYD1_FULL_40_23 TaxID=1798705 RepID=A0A1F6PB78_9BACT|nr:MAG: protein-export membrane protein SecD [Candidatus Magasanikbacteria bacterium RIFOXYD1_FULL_40_23]
MAVKNQVKTVSKDTLKSRVFLIFLLTVFCLIIVFPTYANKGISWVNAKANIGIPSLPNKGFSLGLDLQGGAHLVYHANTEVILGADKADAVEGVRDVIERRVRGGLGVSEPLVQTTRVNDDYRIIVELPGITDVSQAIKMIGETPILEFKEESDEPLRELTAEEKKEMNTYNAQARAKASEALKDIASGMDFTDAAIKYSEDEGVESHGGDLGFIDNAIFPEFYKWAETHKDGEVSKELISSFDGLNIIKRLSAQEKEGADASSTVKTYNVARISIKIKKPVDIVPPAEQWKTTGLSGKQLKRAEVSQDSQTGQVQVALNFDDEGTELFADLTRRNTGRPVAIFLDGSAISVPQVNEPILTGSAVISGSFSLQEARLLAQRLNSGALPVPVELISQQKVDATLGADSLQKSFMAGIYGLIAVLIYMVIYYRLPGVLAAASLCIYVLLNLVLFKVLNVTLTLSGIAGFILSIGMAVDANVLVFERLKEELRSGRGLKSAVEEAFVRAWPSIRDSNTTTLISCIFMVWMGGFVKGFAVVLAIGVMVSMFSAIVLTRTIIRAVLLLMKDEANVLFLGYSKKKELI